MKNVHQVIAIALFAAGCGNISSHDSVKDFIPGTYARSYYDSIGIKTSVGGDDTLRIKKQTESGSETFQVDWSTRTERTWDGRKEPVKYHKETWTCSYRESDKTLYNNHRGGTIAFDVKNRLLKIGASEYRKIE
jgi:hypothetical protein